VIRLGPSWRAQEKGVDPHHKPFRLGPTEKLLESARDVRVAVPVRTLRRLDHAELVPFRPGPLEVQPALVLRMNVDPEDGFLFTHCLADLPVVLFAVVLLISPLLCVVTATECVSFALRS
jgi:hypothetical protein